ncbi:hypothetical protein LP420_04595 [Massilia sp. B-10]|nr:hypothetical protein LP420_04595 [Massilia sp. B-10]
MPQNKRLRIAATLCALLWSCASSLHATEVHVAFGEKIAPFCFPETDSGIELDVMREALAFRGHTMVPHYYSFARGAGRIQGGRCGRLHDRPGRRHGGLGRLVRRALGFLRQCVLHPRRTQADDPQTGRSGLA